MTHKKNFYCYITICNIDKSRECFVLLYKDLSEVFSFDHTDIVNINQLTLILEIITYFIEITRICMCNKSIICGMLFASGAITCYLPWQNM